MNLTQIEGQVMKDGRTEVVTRLRYKTPDGYIGAIVEVKPKPKEIYGEKPNGKDKACR